LLNFPNPVSDLVYLGFHQTCSVSLIRINIALLYYRQLDVSTLFAVASDCEVSAPGGCNHTSPAKGRSSMLWQPVSHYNYNAKARFLEMDKKTRYPMATIAPI